MEVQSFEEGAIVQFSVKSHGSVIFIGKVKRFIPATVSSSPTYRIECRNGRTVDIVPASLTRVEGVVELTLCPAETQAQYQLQVSVAGESRLLCLGEKVEYNIKDGLPSPARGILQKFNIFSDASKNTVEILHTDGALKIVLTTTTFKKGPDVDMLPITPPPLKPQAVAAGAKAASPGAAGKNKYTLYTKNDDNWHLKYEKYKTKYLELKYLNN